MNLPPIEVLIARLEHEIHVASIHNDADSPMNVAVHLGRAEMLVGQLREKASQ